MPTDDSRLARAADAVLQAAATSDRRRIERAVRALVSELERPAPPSVRVGWALRVLGELVRDETSAAYPGAVEAAVALGRLLDGSRWPEASWGGLIAVLYGVALARRFSTTRDLRTLDLSIEALRRGDGLARSGPGADAGRSTRIMALSYLSYLCRRRYEHRGDPADLEVAIGAVEQILAWEPDDDHAQLELALNLSGRYEVAMRQDDLERAGRAAEIALAADPRDPWRLGCLAVVLRLQHQRHADLARVRRSVELLREARRLAPEDVQWSADLAQSLTALFVATDDTRALDEAIAAQRDAAQRTRDGEPAKVRILLDLGSSLLDLHNRHRNDTGAVEEAVSVLREAASADHPMRLQARMTLAQALKARAGTPRGTERDLAEAVRIVEKTIAALPAGDPRRQGFVNNLSLLRQDQHARGGGTARLSDAVRLAEEAVATAPLGREDRRFVLAMALEERFLASGDEGDRLRALRAYADVATAASASTRDRARAGERWGSLAARGEDWAEAAAAYRTSVEAASALAPPELRRADQEHVLTIFPAPAADAAAAVLRHDGDANAAFELLEGGRGVLLGQAAGKPPRDGMEPDGPVVAVNVSEYGCAALIRTAGEVTSVSLPGLDFGAVEDRAEAIGLALKIVQSQELFDTEDVWSATRFVTKTLNWLWDAVAEPVLDTLGFAPRPAGAPLPRMWWMPVGPMTFLPLHAAGHHMAADGRTVMDRAVSSYTPTLAALRRAAANDRPDGGPPARPLVVEAAQVPGQPELPGARQEAAAITALLRQTKSLRDGQATRRAVLRALADRDLVHFACHAASHPTDPSSAHLLLADGPLSVAELSELRVRKAHLAFLSACATAQATVALTNEAIHISSAFQLAGFPHVVSTLWPVQDETAAEIAEIFYLGLIGGDFHPAIALHNAARVLRDRNDGGHPLRWAAHIHAGP